MNQRTRRMDSAAYSKVTMKNAINPKELVWANGSGHVKVLSDDISCRGCSTAALRCCRGIQGKLIRRGGLWQRQVQVTS